MSRWGHTGILYTADERHRRHDTLEALQFCSADYFLDMSIYVTLRALPLSPLRETHIYRVCRRHRQFYMHTHEISWMAYADGTDVQRLHMHLLGPILTRARGYIFHNERRDA